MFLRTELKTITGKDQDARGALRKRLRNAFKNGDHSDMTIKLSDGRELHCNRMIVFPQCDFFRAALEPGRFKEGFTGIVEMPNDPPEVVEAMLEFLYTADYSTDDELDLPDQLLFHLDMYTLSHIYGLSTLRHVSEERILWVFKRDWDAVLQVLPEVAERLIEIFETDAYFNLFDIYNHYSDLENALFEYVLDEADSITMEETWSCMINGAPRFMAAMAEFCDHQWKVFAPSETNSVKWLLKVKGYAETGIVVQFLECPSCHFVHEWIGVDGDDDDCQRCQKRYAVHVSPVGQAQPRSLDEASGS